MKSVFDEQTLSIPCPRCSKETKKKIGWLKRNREMTCAACGETFGLDSKEFLAEIAKAERAIEDLMKNISRI